MELQDYLRTARTSWRLIATVVLVATAVATGLSFSATPRYRATTQIFVSVQTGDSTADLLQGSSFSQRQVKSYAEMVNTPVVLAPVVEQLGLDRDPAALAGEVTASSPADTVLIDITVSDQDPELAAAIANATAESFAVVVSELEAPTDGSGSPVRASVVRPATAPAAATSPDHRLDLTLGALAGAVLGLGAALLRRALDNRIQDDQDVAALTPASIIGAIDDDPHGADRPLIVQSDPHGPRAEAYRRLRTNLTFLRLDGGARSIVVTSTVPDEGKSTSAANLAIVLADAGHRVLLVDADLRRPSIARYLGLEGAAGLTTVLIGQATLDDVVQPWGNGFLDVLASGPMPPNPSELLGSSAMSELLVELTRRYDVVLMDSPPLLPVTDAVVLSTQASGALLVVGSGLVQRRQLAEAVGALDAVGARLLGVVLNRLPRGRSGTYDYSAYAPDTSDPGQVDAGRPARRFRIGRRGGARPASGLAAPDAPHPVPVDQSDRAADEPAGAVRATVRAGNRWPALDDGATDRAHHEAAG